MADAPAWFVVPVQPGLISQVTGVFTGSHGTYKVVKTFVGHPLYDQYLAQGFGPPYPSYAAAEDEARKLAGQAAANPTPGIIPGEQPGAAATKIPGISGLDAIAAALAKAVGYLGDLSMWRSLGWLLLGAVMIILGVVLWLKKENFLPSTVPLPV